MNVKKRLKRRLIKNTILVTGVTVGVITVVILVKRNQKVSYELKTALEGYLTLANACSIVTGENLAEFLNRYEAASQVSSFDRIFGPCLEELS